MTKAWTTKQFYEHNGGLDKLFAKHLTGERKRLLELFKSENITIKQIKLFSQIPTSSMPTISNLI